MDSEYSNNDINYPVYGSEEYYESRVDSDPYNDLETYGETKSYTGKQVGNAMITADIVIPSGKTLTVAGLGVKKYVDKVKLIKTDEHDNPYKIPRVQVQTKNSQFKWNPNNNGASNEKQEEWRDMTIQERNISRMSKIDSDGDNVPDEYDCQPNNIMRQDSENPQQWVSQDSLVNYGKRSEPWQQTQFANYKQEPRQSMSDLQNQTIPIIKNKYNNINPLFRYLNMSNLNIISFPKQNINPMDKMIQRDDIQYNELNFKPIGYMKKTIDIDKKIFSPNLNSSNFQNTMDMKNRAINKIIRF